MTLQEKLFCFGVCLVLAFVSYLQPELGPAGWVLAGLVAMDE